MPQPVKPAEPGLDPALLTTSMRAKDFRAELRRRLETWSDRVVLRILVSASDQTPVELTGRDVLERSIDLVDRYLDAPQEGVVLLLLPHSVELFLLPIGLILRERVPAILAWPTARVDPEKYQRNVLHQLRNLPAAQLLTLPRLARNLDPGLPYRVTACPIARAEQLKNTFEVELTVEMAEKRVETRPDEDTPEDALLLQFSGGTTGSQKCVVVTANMLETHLRHLAASLNFGPRDVVVSWLPLYHDMGLIACLWLPLWSGALAVQLSAQDWLMKPALLFELMERFMGTFCWLPNFAFAYLAAQRGRIQSVFSLGHVRAWINCSEPVRQRSITAFTEAFGAWGVRPEQCQASYGMAENVFAITQTTVGEIPISVPRSQLDGRSFPLSHLAFDVPDDVYTSSGRTLAGMQIRIRDANGDLAGENHLGGIEIHTECIFAGYWGSNGFQAHALLSDGWYVTGDYGFVSGQNLFVIGRTKDIVIVGGQNVFPEDVEMVVNSVRGVYPGRAVAFGIEDSQQGTENLAVVAEMRGEFEAARAHQMEREIQRQVLAAIGIAPRFVRVVPERWIVKSTAGKISRNETRLRFLEDTLSTPSPGKALLRQ